MTLFYKLIYNIVLWLVTFYLKGFVFCRAVQAIADIAISGNYMSVNSGDINILPYKCIQDFVLDGRMHLLWFFLN